MSVEEIEAVITIFTSTIKSAKKTLQTYIIRRTYPSGDSAIPDVEELQRGKRKARKTCTISSEQLI
jgi:hypothetical protein